MKGYIYVNSDRLRDYIKVPLSEAARFCNVSRQRFNGWLKRDRMPDDSYWTLMYKLKFNMSQQHNIRTRGKV